MWPHKESLTVRFYFSCNVIHWNIFTLYKFCNNSTLTQFPSSLLWDKVELAPVVEEVAPLASVVLFEVTPSVVEFDWSAVDESWMLAEFWLAESPVPISVAVPFSEEAVSVK